MAEGAEVSDDPPEPVPPALGVAASDGVEEAEALSEGSWVAESVAVDVACVSVEVATDGVCEDDGVVAVLDTPTAWLMVVPLLVLETG